LPCVTKESRWILLSGKHMKRPAHHIQKQFIEIQFAGMEEAMGLQNEMAGVFYTKLQPKMEALFDELCDDQHSISLERLEIDCGVLPGTAWEEEWVEMALRKLKAELLTVHRKPLSVASNESSEACFLFYLEQGHLPWNNVFDSVKELEAGIELTPLFIKKLKTLFVENPGAARRAVNSFSINAFVQDNREWQRVQWVADNFHIEEAIKDEGLLVAFSGDENPVAAFLSQLHKRVDAKTKVRIEAFAENKIELHVQERNASETQRSNQQKVTELYVENAGLVLLHPFLPQFFSELDFTEKNQWKEKTSQEMAARVLHYLVAAEDEYDERVYSLNKILCGLHPADVVENGGPLPPETKEVGEVLLSSVIAHWKQLKNTGTEAFRQTFLLRAGKLVRMDEGWLLQVEAKAVDVLLGYLPWGIGVIKLPWMKEIVYVEWG
jgi:hypothetical protein